MSTGMTYEVQTEVMTHKGVVTVVLWEMDGRRFMCTGEDPGLALALAMEMTKDEKDIGNAISMIGGTE